MWRRALELGEAYIINFKWCVILMRRLPRWRTCRWVWPLVGLGLLVFVASVASVSAANLGTVFPIFGQVTDLVYDAQHDLVYLTNFNRNQVEIYSVGSRQMVGSIPTGLQPASLALSPDGQRLYVANIGSLSTKP